MVPLSWYLIFSAALFSIGLFGVLSRRNAVAILLGVELMLNSVNLCKTRIDSANLREFALIFYTFAKIGAD